MGVTITVRFPHGQYHATAWDSAANGGDVEWPPSPWRLARALLSVWYTRCPHIPETHLAEVLDVLREPPRYWLPPVTSEHTRHYFPQTEFRSGDEKPKTVMTLDSAVHVTPGAPIVYQWEREVSQDARSSLSTLVESLPYLGRAESVCEAELVDDLGVLGSLDPLGWCEPAPDGGNRVLCLTESTTRAELEQRPDAMRAAKRLQPEASRWVSYTRPVRSPDRRRSGTPAARPSGVRVVRWRVSSTAPFGAEFGLYATEALRAGRTKALEEADSVTSAWTGHIMRKNGLSGPPLEHDGHEAVHWFWLEGGDRGEVFDWSGEVDRGSVVPPAGRRVRDLAVWLPREDIDERAVASVVRGYRGQSGLFRPRGYQPKGYVPADLHLVGVGSPEMVLPELVRPTAREWVSATPYLVTRHRRRSQTVPEFIEADVRREWSRRSFLAGAELESVEVVDAEYPSRWAQQYRRRRWLLPEGARRSRGMGVPSEQAMVRLRLTRPLGVPVPVALGALSHFGFGLFVPMR